MDESELPPVHIKKEPVVLNPLLSSHNPTAGLQVPLVEPINSYYMVIFPKLPSVAQVPLKEPINSYYMVFLPKLTTVTQIPMVEPMNSYYMVISPKLT